MSRASHPSRVAALAALATFVFAASIRAETPPVVTEFPTGLTTSGLANIVAGPDGGLWFTHSAVNDSRIGRIDPTSHAVTTVGTPTAHSQPTGIAAGPDGALWFTESGANQIGRIDPTSQVITEFPIPTANSNPTAIVLGADGALWFTESNANNIGRIDATSHHIDEFSTGPLSPTFIVAGADGGLWFSQRGTNQIERIDPSTHRIEAFPTALVFGLAPATIQGLAAAPDGTILFTDPNHAGVGTIDPTNNSVRVSAVGAISPQAIIAGPDGAFWFVDSANAKIGRGLTEFPIPAGAAGIPLVGITAGPDGAVWFTEAGTNSIGRISVPLNTLTVTPTGSGVGTVTSVPAGIACGNGHTDCSANFFADTTVTLTAAAASGSTFVGWSGFSLCLFGTAPCGVSLREDTATSADFVADTTSDVVLVSAILPASRSVQVGRTATVFGTIINASTDTAATHCTVQPATDIPATFAFQFFDLATNADLGFPNAPVDIPAGQSRSLILALTAAAPFAPTDVAFTFACSNANAAATLSGINTLLLSAATTQPSDIVALAATGSNGGIVNIPGATGTGAFAVASVNVGASAAITVSADTGAASLPVTLTLCETNPATGLCLAPPGASVSAMINANDTPTFAVFAQGGGTVPFAPAANRVFVRFKDASGTVRGATSVAVRTQ